MSFHLQSITRHSLSYVLLQIITAAALILTAPWQRLPFVNYLGLTIGLGIMVWSLWCLRWKQLSIMPEVRSNGNLITTGPYRIVRHPMYTGLLIATASTLTTTTLLSHGWLWCLLLLTLDQKSTHEEKMLLQAYPEYKQYRKTRRKLIPGLY